MTDPQFKEGKVLRQQRRYTREVFLYLSNEVLVPCLVKHWALGTIVSTGIFFIEMSTIL